MPKMQIDAQELVGADARFVSMVNRGANRLPFRVMKQGPEDMLDLNQVGKDLFKSETTRGAEVIGVVMRKGADEKAILSMFRDAGLDPKEFQKSEGDSCNTAIRPDAQDLEGSTVVKMNDDVALIVTGIQKAFDDWSYDESNFGEALQVSGHIFSMMKAVDVFSEVAMATLREADSPEDAGNRLSRAATQFRDYVVQMTKSLPEHAFKMDQSLAKAQNGTGDGAEEGKGTGTTDSATQDDAENSALRETGKGTTGIDLSKAQKTRPQNIPEAGNSNPGGTEGFAEDPEDTWRSQNRATRDDAQNTTHGSTGGSSIPDGDKGLTVSKTSDAGGLVQTGTDSLPDSQTGAGAQTEQDPEEGMASILSALQGLQKEVQGLSGVRDDIKSMQDSLTNLQTRTTKTEEVLDGAVFHNPAGDRSSAFPKKSDQAAPSAGLIDTGYRNLD